MEQKETKKITANAFLTPKELAEHFRVTPVTVRNWINSGALLAVRTPGGEYRIPVSELTKLSIELEKETAIKQDGEKAAECQE